MGRRIAAILLGGLVAAACILVLMQSLHSGVLVYRSPVIWFSRPIASMGCSGYTCYVLMRGGYLAAVDEVYGVVSEVTRISMSVGNATLVASSMCISPSGRIVVLLTDVGTYRYVAIAALNSSLKPVWIRLWRLNETLYANPFVLCALHEIVIYGVPRGCVSALSYGGSLLWVVTAPRTLYPPPVEGTVEVPTTVYSDLIPIVVTNSSRSSFSQAVIIVDARSLEPVAAFSTRLWIYSYQAVGDSAVLVLADTNYVPRKVLWIDGESVQCLAPPPVLRFPLPAIVGGEPVLVGVNGNRSVIVSLNLGTGVARYFQINTTLALPSAFWVGGVGAFFGVGNPVAMSLVSQPGAVFGKVAVLDESGGKEVSLSVSKCIAPARIPVKIERHSEPLKMKPLTPPPLREEATSVSHRPFAVWTSFGNKVRLETVKLGSTPLKTVMKSARIIVLYANISIHTSSGGFSISGSTGMLLLVGGAVALLVLLAKARAVSRIETRY